MELRLINEKPLEAPVINVSAETPTEAPVKAAAVPVKAAAAPVKAPVPVQVQAPAKAPAIVVHDKKPLEIPAKAPFKKSGTKAAMKLICFIAVSTIALGVGLFYTIKSHSKGKTPPSATIAIATETSGQPAKPVDQPAATANANVTPSNNNIPADHTAAKPETAAKDADKPVEKAPAKPGTPNAEPEKTATLNSKDIPLNPLTAKAPTPAQLNSTEIKLNATEIMLSPFTEVPTRKTQLNNTEIVLNTLTGQASEQAKLNSTTILLRPLGAPMSGTGSTLNAPAPRVIASPIGPIPDAFKREVIIHTLSADTLFDASPSTLCTVAEEHLAPFAAGMKKHPELPILIRCYTDNIGTAQENLTLSRKRAEAIRNWLVKKTGIPAKNITTIGMGASEPIASNTYSDGTDNFQGRARNRRITITTPTLTPSKTPEPPIAPSLVVKATPPAAPNAPTGEPTPTPAATEPQP